MTIKITRTTKLDIKAVHFDGHLIGHIHHTCCGFHNGRAYGAYYAFKPVPDGPVPHLGSPSITTKMKVLVAKIRATLGCLHGMAA
jgi:hypothetical protein